MVNFYKVSSSGLLVVFAFVLLLISFRFLLPYSDEPDWGYRISHILNTDLHLFFYPDYSGVLESYTKQDCSISSRQMDFFGFISQSCLNPVDFVLSRTLLVLYTLLPLFAVLIFPRFFYSCLVTLKVKIEFVEWERRLNALKVFLLFPGAIYYLSVLSIEQFFLVVALYVFLFWNIALIPVFLLSLLSLIDFGNFIVVALFVSFFYFLRFIYLTFGFQALSICSLFFLLVSYSFNGDLIHIIPLPDILNNKVEGIMKVIIDGAYYEKYPLLLRPVITFMGFILLLPSGVKSSFGIFFVLLTLPYLLYKGLLVSRNMHDTLLFLLAPILFILIFIFIFPTYSFSKYYVFLLPFIFYTMSSSGRFHSSLLFSLITSIVVIINLALYYI